MQIPSRLRNRSPKKMDDFMEQSIRNEIPGTVKEIISDKVLSEIIVETRIGEMAAVITTRSVQDMGLKVGDRVAALVKATNVSLRRPVL
jgi:molybdopterin-binding protein